MAGWIQNLIHPGNRANKLNVENEQFCSCGAKTKRRGQGAQPLGPPGSALGG